MRIKSNGLDLKTLKRLSVSPEHTKVKILDDEDAPNGMLEGYASVFNNVDSGGDVVRKGAFRKTIKERLKKRQILLYDSHAIFEGTQAVIGLVKQAKEDDYGLWFQAGFSGTSRAQEVRQKIREGILSALSFGYDIIKAKPSDEHGPDVMELTELRLWEISVVPWGMNPKAEAQVVKGVIPVAGFGLAPKDRAWDAAAAKKRLQDWAEGDWAKFRRAFLWYDPEKEETVGGYYFPVADVIDGSPKFVFRAASAALGRVRGGSGIWSGDADKIEASIKKIYAKFDEEFPEKDASPLVELKSLSDLSREVQDYALAMSLRKIREGLGNMAAK